MTAEQNIIKNLERQIELYKEKEIIYKKYIDELSKIAKGESINGGE